MATWLILDGDGVVRLRVRQPQGGLLLVLLLHLGGGPGARRSGEASASSRWPAPTRITEPMFTIDWHFLTGGGELESAEIEEIADDALLDERVSGDRGWRERASSRAIWMRPESVLVLQGPPGTGKTRLIRAILGEIVAPQGRGETEVLYTGDMRALESDEIFVKFITG